ncbi:hypothetical protein Bbelb_385650 [Branchiostoma belcheri]|nr:hypothetical protein Bbelb_385650 [Branchiostoma belcheri]
MADGFMKDISACNKRSFPARHDQYCSTAGQGRLGPGWEAEPDIDVMEDMLFQVTTSNRLIQRRRPLPHLPGHFPGTEYLHCSCQIDRGRQEAIDMRGQLKRNTARERRGSGWEIRAGENTGKPTEESNICEQMHQSPLPVISRGSLAQSHLRQGTSIVKLHTARRIAGANRMGARVGRRAVQRRAISGMAGGDGGHYTTPKAVRWLYYVHGIKP